MVKTLSAQTKNWTEKAKRNGQLVMKSSVQKLAEAVYTDVGSGPGRISVITGNLANSLMASTAAMPAVREGTKENPYPWAGPVDALPPEIVFTIEGMDAGQTIWLGWQAAYARRHNYGFVGTDSLGRSYSQGGKFFLERQAAKWQQFVDEAAREIGT